MKITTVSEYVVQRLVDIGIQHCFGVPGDYAFPISNAIEQHADIHWIGCANELNAAYAADGYARIKGAALLSTTYAPGELSALNGVMGAKAEHVVVFHLVGMPSMRVQQENRLVHHSLGDGIFQNFTNISAQACCVMAIINVDNYREEMDRVIATAFAKQQPAYILIAQDVANMPVNFSGQQKNLAKPQSDTASLTTAASEIQRLLLEAKTVVILPAYIISRLKLQTRLQAVIEKSGLPFVSMMMDKAVLSETHPQFIGMYAGNCSGSNVKQLVDTADLVINVGGAIFNDANTLGFDFNLDLTKMITINMDKVIIKNHVYERVRIEDVLDAMVKMHYPTLKFPVKKMKSSEQQINPEDKITTDAFYFLFERFLKANDIVIAETGSAAFGVAPLRFPFQAVFHNQTQWGAIGWATGAALGTSLADCARRTVLISGEGAHQIAANELGSFARYGAKLVIFILNNGGYMIERALEKNPNWHYNNLAAWEYHKLPAALGCKDWFTVKVTTNAELMKAMDYANTHDQTCYIEVVSGAHDYPPLLTKMRGRFVENVK